MHIVRTRLDYILRDAERKQKDRELDQAEAQFRLEQAKLELEATKLDEAKESRRLERDKLQLDRDTLKLEREMFEHGVRQSERENRVAEERLELERTRVRVLSSDNTSSSGESEGVSSDSLAEKKKAVE